MSTEKPEVQAKPIKKDDAAVALPETRGGGVRKEVMSDEEKRAAEAEARSRFVSVIKKPA